MKTFYLYAKPDFIKATIAKLQLLANDDPLLLIWSYEFLKILISSMVQDHTFDEVTTRLVKFSAMLLEQKLCTVSEVLKAQDLAHEAITEFCVKDAEAELRSTLSTN